VARFRVFEFESAPTKGGAYILWLVPISAVNGVGNQHDGLAK